MTDGTKLRAAHLQAYLAHCQEAGTDPTTIYPCCEPGCSAPSSHLLTWGPSLNKNHITYSFTHSCTDHLDQASEYSPNVLACPLSEAPY